ncbi:MAG: hypothetical protein HY245_14215 [Rhizobiales bacterium]|nr:hypothetical protein [Hyphomicrobiales bacterium]MBI3674547.1 hypothetical protein [Hyphomicrobiales bacterium]
MLQFPSYKGPEALLPDRRQAKLIPDDEDCQLAPPTERKNGPPGWAFFQIVPVDKHKADYDAQLEDEIPDTPCGEMGYAADYVGFFMIPAAHPDRVLYLNLGQDGTMFDPFSIA